MTPDQADRIIRELDRIARIAVGRTNAYGLPVSSVICMELLRAAVLRIANEKPPDEWAAAVSEEK